MATIDINETLANLVISNPQMAAPMEKWGLDYCCGGKTKLNDAVNKAGLNIEEVVTILEETNSTEADIDWTTLPLNEIVDRIESIHHTYLHEELPLLCALADKVQAAHGTNHLELADVARLVREIHDDLEPHMRKEEMMLFPMVRQLANATTLPMLPFGSFVNPISVMLAEHDVTGDLLSELREVTSNYEIPADACTSYKSLYTRLAILEADTHLHIHRENNILFPAALEKEKALSHDGGYANS